MVELNYYDIELLIIALIIHKSKINDVHLCIHVISYIPMSALMIKRNLMKTIALTDGILDQAIVLINKRNKHFVWNLFRINVAYVVANSIRRINWIQEFIGALLWFFRFSRTWENCIRSFTVKWREKSFLLHASLLMLLFATYACIQKQPNKKILLHLCCVVE